MTDSSKYKPKYVPKGWGHELWIVNKEEYCGKLLFIKKDKKCSWHFHRLKDEVFYLQSGKLLVRYSDKGDINECKTLIMNPGDSFHVYRLLKHQMEALEDSELFEFSTQHFDSDSHRIIKGD
jgi:quercetin dioxygenase-like cupin family protein